MFLVDREKRKREAVDQHYLGRNWSALGLYCHQVHGSPSNNARASLTLPQTTINSIVCHLNVAAASSTVVGRHPVDNVSWCQAIHHWSLLSLLTTTSNEHIAAASNKPHDTLILDTEPSLLTTTSCYSDHTRVCHWPITNHHKCRPWLNSLWASSCHLNLLLLFPKPASFIKDWHWPFFCSMHQSFISPSLLCDHKSKRKCTFVELRLHTSLFFLLKISILLIWFPSFVYYYYYLK